MSYAVILLAKKAAGRSSYSTGQTEFLTFAVLSVGQRQFSDW